MYGASELHTGCSYYGKKEILLLLEFEENLNQILFFSLKETQHM